MDGGEYYGEYHMITIPDRIYSQYRSKPKATGWFNITPAIAEQLTNVYDDVRNMYDIDAAGTAELNIIGRIVGISRSFESMITNDTYDWGGSVSQFGGSGVQFKSPTGLGGSTVSNDIYRMLIKAEIAKNNGDATIDNIIFALSNVIDVSAVSLIDYENMTFSVTLYSELTTTERFVLNTFDIVPRPQGVKFLGFIEQPSVTWWGGSYNWGDSRAQFGQYFGG